MLLLNKMAKELEADCSYFNTSYVVIKPVQYAGNKFVANISIHLMLLLIK